MMQDAVLKIQKLGVPPEGFEDCGFDVDEEICQIWDNWIEAVCAILFRCEKDCIHRGFAY